MSTIAGVGLALGLAASAVPPAQALSAVSHGVGYASGSDGRWLGSYRMDDGRLGFCIDVGLAGPPGHAYSPVEDTGATPDDRARLAYISRRWAGSADPDTAAAGQLATWSVTGLGAHDLSWYAARAGDHAGTVESRARDMLAEAASGASRSVTAAATVALGDDGTGSVRVDLRADLVATGPTDVPAGSQTGTVTLDGAAFDDGSTTARVANGTAVPIRATGSSAALHVTASAVFASLPYGDALDAVGDGGASQRMILARPADARADAQADARAPSPLPFAPRVVTRTSRAVAAVGDELADALRVSADPATPADHGRPATSDGWGLARQGDGSLVPVPVVVRSRLLGPFPEQVGPERDEVPAGAPQVCAVVTRIDRGPGDYSSPACRLPAGGFYAWVETISPDDTPVAAGRARVLPWRSTFGAATETTQVPQPPRITTTIGSPDVPTGDCQTDTLHTTSFVGVGPVPVHVRLVGPFATAPAEGTPVAVPDDGGAGAPGADVALAGDGDVTTPCMRVPAPGWYVAVLDSPGRPAGEADGAAIAPFSDHIAHADEAFHVSPPTAGVVAPPPARARLAMTGGAPGVDVPGSGGTAHADASTLACAAASVGVLGAVGVGARRAGRRRTPARASRWARS
ncbi:hypothetical protein ABID70_001834 [Clavibacter michiganensis]|uniref:hypothetical protein n=1 Tax=Clavibacter michiganensis TaxID=28447 RepID=UPI001D1B3242|nr:hypothetical protein [Clavibacter michiganensis]MBP2456314.1 hypothetical protein [Clavibacter michiganensis]MDQ0408884.1 hypothetical protein [Clavibacter michiganensis]